MFHCNILAKVHLNAGNLRLRVLGTPALVDQNGKSPPSLGWGKPLALLCLLAVRGEARREEVVDLLWREMEPEKARNTFRQALHRLRSALGEDLLPPDREFVRLVRSPRLVVDLELFDEAIAGDRIEEALSHYTGDFLDHTELGEPPFDLWADQERTRIRARFRNVLRDGVLRASQSGAWPDAIGRARRLLALAPFDNQAAELAATTLVSAGRAVEARELLDAFGERLDSELGLPLSPELKTLQTRLARQVERRPATRLGGNAASPAVFSGREPELAMLMSLWQSTSEDAGALVLVEGDAGMGRSRLVREFLGGVRALGNPLVLAGRERPPGAQLPLGVFADALRPLVRAPGVSGTSRHLLAEAARLLPELRDSFELPPVSHVEDEAARLRFFEGLAALIDAAAYEHPVLIAIEDAHLLPPSSLDLLSYLCARLAGSPVMFVLTARSLGQTIAGSRLLALSQGTDTGRPPHADRAHRIVLAPLTHDAAYAAIEQPAREAGVPAHTVTRVVDAAGGVPARLNELLRRAMSGEDPSPLPVSVRTLIGERLQRLSSAQRRFLLVLAMVGRPMHQHVAANAAHVSTRAAGDMVEALVVAGLARTDDERVSATELASEVVLDSAEPATRSFLAGWIADALAAEPDPAAAELARFLSLAGLPERAFEHARRAAFDALAIGAVAEATQYLQAARTLAIEPDQQREIASYLAALGSGQRLLADPGGSTAQPPQATPPGPPLHASGQVDVPTWQRHFPNWRFLLGGAIATLVISAAVLAPRPPDEPIGRAVADTLVVSEGEGSATRRLVTGDIGSGFTVSGPISLTEPAWLDSLGRPWADAIPSPNGQYVAASLVRGDGSHLLLISADRRDTSIIADGPGEAKALGWSPDSRWLLFSRSGNASSSTEFDNDLHAYPLRDPSRVRLVDGSPQRAIVEAAWSPDGSRIAWVARVGAERQREVYVSLADGTDAQNVSRHPADDFHIAWSGDGALLAFTSMRDGNAELYALGVDEGRLWRLTRDPAQDDRAAYSTSGRVVAFESTRGGVAGTYVMPALGGEPRRIGGSDVLSVVGWRGGPPRYLDRVRIRTDVVPASGDSATVTVLGLDQQGDSIGVAAVRWEILDPSIATLASAPDSGGTQRVVVGQRPGIARLVASVGEWRFDTAFVRVGTQPIALMTLEPEPTRMREWQVVGSPQPAVTIIGGHPLLSLNADREWDSGVLSRSAFPLAPSLEFAALLMLPRTVRDPATSVSMALVAPEADDALDHDAPQFLSYASFTWSAEPRRFVFAVGREVHVESARDSPGAEVDVRLRVEPDSTVTFIVNGAPRWRSALRVITPRQGGEAHAWIGGRATSAAAIRTASVSLGATGASSSP